MSESSIQRPQIVAIWNIWPRRSAPPSILTSACMEGTSGAMCWTVGCAECLTMQIAHVPFNVHVQLSKTSPSVSCSVGRFNTPSPVPKTSPAVALTSPSATRAIAVAASQSRHANDKSKPDTSASTAFSMPPPPRPACPRQSDTGKHYPDGPWTRLPHLRVRLRELESHKGGSPHRRLPP